MSDLSVVLDVQPSKPKRSFASRLKFEREDWIVLAYRVAALIVVFGLWQVFAGGPKSILPSDAISRPSSIFIYFWKLVGNGQLFSALGTTSLGVFYAMIISIPLGTILALLTASRFGRWMFQPLVTVGYAIPKVGLISLYILFFGIRTTVHVALVVSAVVFPYFFAVRQALEEIDPDKLAAMRMMGAGRWKIIRSFTIRSAVPHLFVATRISLPLAFAVEIFAELRVPASTGLGVLLLNFTSVVNSAGSMAVLFFVMFIGYIIDVVVGGWLRRYVDSIGAGVQL